MGTKVLPKGLWAVEHQIRSSSIFFLATKQIKIIDKRISSIWWTELRWCCRYVRYFPLRLIGGTGTTCCGLKLVNSAVVTLRRYIFCDDKVVFLWTLLPWDWTTSNIYNLLTLEIAKSFSLLWRLKLNFFCPNVCVR